jgi:flagellar basal-body rod protein FlgB
MRIFDNTSLPALARVMNLASWRQKTYASNVANATVEGFQRQDANFASQLAAQGGLQMDATQPGHAGSPANEDPTVLVRPDPKAEPGVDLDQEMVALAENQMHFDLAARVTSLRVAGIRTSILGHR